MGTYAPLVNPLVPGVAHFQCGGAPVRLDGNCQTAQRLLRDLPHEPEALHWWGGWATLGGLMVDVGAYTGAYTIGAVLNGAPVLAAEPFPKNLAQLRRNLTLNGITQQRVTIWDGALADFTGRQEIHYRPHKLLTDDGSIVNQQAGWANKTVRTTTLDALLWGQEAVRAIRIDAAGAEPLVLRGTAETLERHRPSLLVTAEGETERGFALLNAPGYAVAGVYDRKILHLEPR